jgi:hypothetical protein
MPESQGYAGWHRPRPGLRWVRICQGADAATVLGQLLDLRPGGDKCVLSADTDPNQSRPTIPRRRRF